MPACQQYAVFGGIRSQSGSSDTDFKFTGEQEDSDDFTHDAAPSAQASNPSDVVTCGRRSLLAAVPISLLIGLVAFFSLACDPSHPVTYENRTDMVVEVFINGKFSASLEPMKKEKFELIEFDEVTFEARDSDGRVIYSETFTWEELKQAGWRIVIEEPASSRPAAPVEAR